MKTPSPLTRRTLVAALAALAATGLFVAACNRSAPKPVVEVTGGDPNRGRAAITAYGCSSCHIVPGVREATGLVGPPLDHMASRSYIGGVLVNRPENMIAWLRDPPKIDEKTAMPNLGVTEQDARDMAAYLYTLK